MPGKRSLFSTFIPNCIGSQPLPLAEQLHFDSLVFPRTPLLGTGRLPNVSTRHSSACACYENRALIGVRILRCACGIRGTPEPERQRAGSLENKRLLCTTS